MRAWTGEVGVACRGVHVAWAARLVDGSSDVVWSGADRLPVGRSADDALVAGVKALEEAAKRHRRHVEAIRTNLHAVRLSGVETGRVPEVTAQALATLPASTGFPAGRISRVSPHRAVAHGQGGDYEIDLVAETCSCPQYRFRRVLCKHLRTALGLGGTVASAADVAR